MKQSSENRCIAKPNVPVRIPNVIYGFILSLSNSEPTIGVYELLWLFVHKFSAWLQTFSSLVLYSLFTLESRNNIKWEVMFLKRTVDVNNLS